MKMSKKVKIIIVIIIVAIGSIAIAYSGFGKNKAQIIGVDVTSQSTAKWKIKAPQLFSNVGYSKLIIESTTNNKNMSIKMRELQGTITNPLGIRDDILDYIINNVPQDNSLVIKAVIRIAQTDQKIYYGNITKQEALLINKKEMLAQTCLMRYLPNKWDKIVTDLDKLLRNSKKRDKYMWDLDTKYFGWEVLGTGYTVGEENELCEKGEF